MNGEINPGSGNDKRAYFHNFWEPPALSEAEVNSYLQFTQRIAFEAGGILREGYYRHREIAHKSGRELVTSADLASEKFVRSQIERTYPEHKILSEEFGELQRTDVENLWVVDPLDGTNNFAHGFPLLCVSIAMVEDGRPVVGVVHDPLHGETFAATAGGGAFLDGQPMHVSPVETLDRAFLATGFPYDRRTAADNNVARLDRLVRHSLGVRRGGAAALDLAYVAAGRFDGFWEIRLAPWDVAAGILLVREAGGRATDFDGEPDCLSGEQIVASNGHIHDQILQHIRQGGAQ